MGWDQTNSRDGWPDDTTPVMASGCCSAISPCSHQQRDPTTICDICRAAAIADKHLARISDHNPDRPMADKVAQGYGNAALNIGHELRHLAKTAR